MSRAHQLAIRLQSINESRRTFKPPFRSESHEDSWCVKDSLNEIVQDHMSEEAADKLAEERNAHAEKREQKIKDLKSGLQSSSSAEDAGVNIGKTLAS